jgi:hypothetical protein
MYSSQKTFENTNRELEAPATSARLINFATSKIDLESLSETDVNLYSDLVYQWSESMKYLDNI